MIKNLLFLLFVLSAIPIFQGKDKAKSNDFFCDTLAPANVTVTNIFHTSATVNWANDPATLDYVIRFRPVGNFSWSSPTVPTGQYYFNLNGLTPCTAYEVQVAKVCNNVQGAWSALIIFNTKLNYCSSLSASSGIMHISNVTVSPSGLPQMVSNSLSSLYTNYRPDPARRVDLLWGSANNEISVTKSGAVSPNAAFVTVWIDFNANGSFENSEIILNFSGSSANISSGLFTVPSLASVGGNISCAVTMRVIFSNIAVNNGCGNFAYGEVEDYDVYLSAESNLNLNEIIRAKEISIYPNPVTDVLHITGITSDLNYKIYNSAGQIIDNGITKNKTVPVGFLTEGTYIIQLDEKENPHRLKFIKK